MAPDALAELAEPMHPYTESSLVHVLILPCNYPNPYQPNKTPFFRDHARATAALGHTTRVVAATGIAVRELVRTRSWPDQRLREETRDAVDEWIQPYLAPPRSLTLDRMVRRWWTRRLIAAYTERFGAPDVIHAHDMPGAQCGVWWQEATQAPLVTTIHSTVFYGSQKNRHARHLQSAVERSGARLAVSRGCADQLEQLTNTRFDVVPNPVDTQFFTRPEAGTAIERPFTFASVGDLRPRKNHALIIRAFAARFARDSYQLVIAGTGPERARLETLAHQLGVGEQVRFTGQLDRHGVRDLLWRSDAFVLASHYETFGVVLAEAMACGVPVVATRSDGPSDIIHDRSLGLLADHNPRSLGDAMAGIVAEPPDSATLRDEVAERYSLVSVGRAVERVHRRLAAP